MILLRFDKAACRNAGGFFVSGKEILSRLNRSSSQPMTDFINHLPQIHELYIFLIANKLNHTDLGTPPESGGETFSSQFYKMFPLLSRGGVDSSEVRG
jgi:hypothetical protein